MDGDGKGYLPWMGEGYLPWTGEGYLPSMARGYLSSMGKGVPTLGGGGGNLPWTGYAAGDMPLAFTQEDLYLVSMNL